MICAFRSHSFLYIHKSPTKFHFCTQKHLDFSPFFRPKWPFLGTPPKTPKMGRKTPILRAAGGPCTKADLDFSGYSDSRYTILKVPPPGGSEVQTGFTKGTFWTPPGTPPRTPPRTPPNGTPKRAPKCRHFNCVICADPKGNPRGGTGGRDPNGPKTATSSLLHSHFVLKPVPDVSTMRIRTRSGHAPQPSSHHTMPAIQRFM